RGLDDGSPDQRLRSDFIDVAVDAVGYRLGRPAVVRNYGHDVLDELETCTGRAVHRSAVVGGDDNLSKKTDPNAAPRSPDEFKNYGRLQRRNHGRAHVEV